MAFLHLLKNTIHLLKNYNLRNGIGPNRNALIATNKRNGVHKTMLVPENGTQTIIAEQKHSPPKRIHDRILPEHIVERQVNLTRPTIGKNYTSHFGKHSFLKHNTTRQHKPTRLEKTHTVLLKSSSNNTSLRRKQEILKHNSSIHQTHHFPRHNYTIRKQNASDIFNQIIDSLRKQNATQLHKQIQLGKTQTVLLKSIRNNTSVRRKQKVLKQNTSTHQTHHFSRSNHTIVKQNASEISNKGMDRAMDRATFLHQNNTNTSLSYQGDNDTETSMPPSTCTHQPCLNGGTCVQVSYATYRCICGEGFDGKHCDGKNGRYKNTVKTM